MVEEDRGDPLDQVLGFRRAASLKNLKDSESKRVIEAVLKQVRVMYPDLKWYGLRVERSDVGLEELKKNIDRLDLARLKMILDIEGFRGVPDEWLDFAEFLVKAQYGKAFECNEILSEMARLIVFKTAGYPEDKEFVRIFYKIPIRRLLRFFRKFKVSSRLSENNNAV